MASLSQKSTPILLVLLAGLVGYIAYTGAVIETLGVSGPAARKDAGRGHPGHDRAGSTPPTDSAKKELAKGTVEDLRKRLDTYRAASRCCAGWCPSGTRCPTCSTTSRPAARSAG